MIILMSYLNDESLYREIIMDHVKNPRNKKTIHDNFKSIYLKNPSCGDELTLYILIENNRVVDLTYEVVGCSICTSSVSMMSELLMGQTIDDVNNIINNFNLMMTGSQYNETLLGDAVSLKGIVNVPPRIKCATLGYVAFSNFLAGEINDRL